MIKLLLSYLYGLFCFIPVPIVMLVFIFCNQAREGFSLPEQRKRLEGFCYYKGYEIKDYYGDAGIRAKTGNKRPEFDRLIEELKQGRINTIIALKLDRIKKAHINGVFTLDEYE